MSPIPTVTTKTAQTKNPAEFGAASPRRGRLIFPRVMSQTMSPLYPGLPDPVTAPEFYADVASKRLIAWIVDTVLIILITVLLVPLTAFTALFYFPFLAMIVSLVYRIVTIANRSATPGMR